MLFIFQLIFWIISVFFSFSFLFLEFSSTGELVTKYSSSSKPVIIVQTKWKFKRHTRKRATVILSHDLANAMHPKGHGPRTLIRTLNFAKNSRPIIRRWPGNSLQISVKIKRDHAKSICLICLLSCQILKNQQKLFQTEKKTTKKNTKQKKEQTKKLELRKYKKSVDKWKLKDNNDFDDRCQTFNPSRAKRRSGLGTVGKGRQSVQRSNTIPTLNQSSQDKPQRNSSFKPKRLRLDRLRVCENKKNQLPPANTVPSEFCHSPPIHLTLIHTKCCSDSKRLIFAEAHGTNERQRVRNFTRLISGLLACSSWILTADYFAGRSPRWTTHPARAALSFISRMISSSSSRH